MNAETQIRAGIKTQAETRAGSQKRIRIQAGLNLSAKTFEFSPLYSGGCLWVDGFKGAVVLDMEGLRELPPEIPCCLEHDESAIVGTMKPEIRETNGIPQLFASGRFLETAEARNVLTAFKGEGKRWEGSVSTKPFSTLNDLEEVPRGQTVRVNRQTFHGPLNVVRRWSLCEGSFVKRGGDVRNAAIIHARLKSQQKEKKMSEELKNFIVRYGFDPDSVTPEQLVVFETLLAAREKEISAELEGEAEKPNEDEIDASGEEEENDPLPELPNGSGTEEGAAEAEDEEDQTGAGLSASEQAEDEEDLREAKARTRARARLKRRNPVSRRLPAGRVSASAGAPALADVYAVAMMRNLGLFTDAQVKASGFSDDAMTEGLAKRFNGWSFRDLACEMFRNATGQVYRGTEDAFVDGFFHPSRVRAAAFSTQNPLGILSNVLNKAYYEGSLRVPSVVSKFAKKILLDNLQDAKITGYDVYGLPPDMGEDAVLKHATLVGEDYDVSIGRSGNILTLTRDMLLKNDVESFVNATLKLGMKHQRKREKRGIQKLLSGIASDSTFSSANGNSISAALSLSGLDQAAAALQSMTVLGSDPLDPEFTDFSGKYLLLPPALAATAQSLFQATNLIASGSGTITLTNTYHRYEPLISSYLSTAAGSGGSDTGWFLLADPTEAAVLAETRIRGAEEPHIVSVDVKDGVIGASWATFFEYGFGLMDHRAAVYSAGAAS